MPSELVIVPEHQPRKLCLSQAGVLLDKVTLEPTDVLLISVGMLVTTPSL